MITFENTAYNHIEPMEEITELTVQINVGDFFSSWEEAEMQLNQYAKTTGFTIRRKCIEVDVGL